MVTSAANHFRYSVADPDPPYPYNFPGSGSVSEILDFDLVCSKNYADLNLHITHKIAQKISII